MECVQQVRTVKPGVYRHTITGLSPSTQYRVTVRAKHLRAGPPSGIAIEEAPGAYTDFRTLPKGLPDPPNEIMVRAYPTLITWHEVYQACFDPIFCIHTFPARWLL